MEATPQTPGRPRSKVRQISTAALLVATIFFATKGLVTRAGVAHFYPSTCLGGWENAPYAQGAPEGSAGDIYSFTRENSAVLESDIAGPVFCGNFTGDVYDSAPLRSVTLRFSWVMSGAPPAVPSSPEEPAAASLLLRMIERAFAQEIQDPPAAAEPPPVETPIDPPAETPPAEPPPSEAAPSESVAEPTEAPEPGSEPVAESQPETESAPEAGIEPTPEPETEDEPQAESEPETATSTEPALAPTPAPVLEVADDSTNFLAVFYTIDGVDWQKLGEVGVWNWDGASFDIPLTDWSNLSKVQVSVQSVPFSGNKPIVYLDAMSLEARYEEYSADAAAENSKDMLAAIGEIITDIPGTVMDLFDGLRQEPEESEAPAQAPQPSFTFAPGLPLDRRGAVSAPGLGNALLSRADGGGALSVSGQCAGKYFTVLLFADADGYANDPSRAVLNKSMPCTGNAYAYTVTAADMPETLKAGTYYLLIGAQGDAGPWAPASPVYPVEIRNN